MSRYEDGVNPYQAPESTSGQSPSEPLWVVLVLGALIIIFVVEFVIYFIV